MKQYCVVHVQENGHTGHCPMCGKEKKLIKVEEYELGVCQGCFLGKCFVSGQFLIGIGIDPGTAHIVAL